MLIGDGFGNMPEGNTPEVEISRLDDGFGASQAKGEVIPCRALQPNDRSVKFIVPDTLGEGAYEVYVKTPNGGIASKLLNVPIPYWAQGDRGTTATLGPRGWIRVFGRSISHNPSRTMLRMTPAGKASGLPLDLKDPQSASVWDAQFTLESADLMPNTTYRLQIYNGWGGDAGWADVGEMRVEKEDPWPDTIFNVREEEFGAVGDGITNDGPAIRKALDAAKDNGGGIVYFPRGRYLVDSDPPTPLELPIKVTLRGERQDGEGQNLVSLVWPKWEKICPEPPHVLIQGSHHFALEDLTLYISTYGTTSGGSGGVFLSNVPLPTCRYGQVDYVDYSKFGHVRIHRVTIRADIYQGHPSPEEVDRRFRMSAVGDRHIRLIVVGGENVVITNSDIYASTSPLHLIGAKGAYIAHNRFYNGRWGGVSIDGCNKVIFEDNEIVGADLMTASGTGMNTHTTSFAASQNVFYALNTLRLIHGWDREAMNTDGSGGYYYGRVKDVTPKSIGLSGEPTAPSTERQGWKGAGVFILAGKGMGQFAQVDCIEDTGDGKVVHLDRPWAVLPDDSSVITITVMRQNYLCINNSIEDAGVAIQYYGVSINHIAAGNKSTRTGGFWNLGMHYLHFQPAWYCQFLDNEILEGNVYRGSQDSEKLSCEALLGTFGHDADGSTTLALGTVYRRNRLHSNAHIEIAGTNGIGEPYPATRDVIVERNKVKYADIGFKVYDGSSWVLLRENEVEHAHIGLKVDRSSCEWVVSQDNGYKDVIEKEVVVKNIADEEIIAHELKCPPAHN